MAEKSAMALQLEDTVKGIHRGRRGMLGIPPDSPAVIQRTKSGCMMVTFNRTAAFFRRLFQVDLEKDSAMAALVRSGFLLDAFAIQSFCEDLSKKPEDAKVVTLGSKQGWWQYSDWCVVVRKDKTVEYTREKNVYAEAIKAAYK